MNRLKALPIRLIEVEGGIIIKRGRTELKIGGEYASQIVQTVLASAATDEGATREEILESFAPSSKPAITHLVDQLLAQRLLVPLDSGQDSLLLSDQETPLDIFYWHYGQTASRVSRSLNLCRFSIVGVNYISRQLVMSLTESGVTNIQVVDHPLLRNLRLFDKKQRLNFDYWPSTIGPPQPWAETLQDELADCLVATTDFGNTPLLHDINRFCVKAERHFLPIVLQDHVGYIGPLVIPGETACFECLRTRQRSHDFSTTNQWPQEESAFACQDIVGFHPSMASILGDLAAVELTQFYSGAWPKKRAGTLIEINLCETQLLQRNVLKIPRCVVCSPLVKRPSMAVRKTPFVSRGKPTA